MATVPNDFLWSRMACLCISLSACSLKLEVFTLTEPSIYAKRKFLIGSNLSLYLQHTLHLSSETDSPSAFVSKSNHVIVSSDLSLSRIHFWTVFFSTRLISRGS